MADIHSMTGTVQADATQVVQFRLGTERYCVEIDRVAELVHMDELTTIPNADAHVEGVMDLRGQTTTILDPRVVLDVDEDGARKRVIVFEGEDGDQGDVGWVVDEVEEVRTIPDEDVDTSATGDHEAVRGIVKDEEFKVLLDPDEING